MTSVISSLDNLAKEVRERQRFPWGAASFALGVVALLAAVITFGFMAYIGEIRGGQDNLQNQVTALSQSALPRSIADERQAQTERRLLTIESGIVTRGEHQSQWNNQQQATADIQRQIDQLRGEVGSSYSLNDALSTIEERLERLEQLRLQQTVPIRQ